MYLSNRKASPPPSTISLEEVTSSRGADYDHERRSGDSEDSKIASYDSGHPKVAVAAALAGISYNFGLSGITKACVKSMENYACHFPKGYGRAPGTEFVSEPRANEAIVFEDFFTVRLSMPLLAVLEPK
jgi:hypothetical protein